MSEPAPSTIDLARQQARKQWRTASPYRVGLMVGELGLTATNPYDWDRPAHTHFENGVREGRDRAEKARLAQ